MTAHIKPIYVRVKDSQAVFGLGRSTIYEMVKRGSASLLKVAEIEAVIEIKLGT